MIMRTVIKNVSYFALAVILSFLFLANTASAETKTFIKEYTYQASDEDSKNSSRTIALREVKRLILEELGTYLESQTEVQNFKLTKDQIVTLTAGIVQTELIEEKWNGKIYWLQAKIIADSDGVIKSIDSLRKDRVKTKELEDAKKKSEALLKENQLLRKQLATAKGKKREKDKVAYTETIKGLSSIEWYEKASAYFELGDYINALDAYNKSIEFDPKYADAYLSRGVVNSLLDNEHGAIKDFDKVIELKPKDTMTMTIAYVDRGASYSSLGDNQQAISDYSMAIELNPNFAVAYYNRGVKYDDIGKHHHAISDFDKAIEINPKHEASYDQRGIAYENIGKYQKAINDYNKAIELNPNNYKAYNNRGGAFVKIQNYQQAISDFDKAIGINSKVVQIYVNRGKIYQIIGNYRQAITDFDKAIDINPKFASAYFNRGITYSTLGNDEQRNADLRIAARLGYKDAQDILKTIGVDWL